MVQNHRVTVFPGDGIGPEVVDAAREVLDASGVALEWEIHQIGQAALDAGADGPVPEAALASVRENGVALKGPLSTDAGRKLRSPNVALRRALDLYVQVRPVRRFPGVVAPAALDLVLVRIMTEDVNAGIEYLPGSPRARALAAWIAEDGFTVDPDSGFSLKVASASEIRRGVEFAFAWAREHGRRRVTAVHKATIMRATDALLLETARAVGAEHPTIELDDRLLDDAAVQLVRDPGGFDVVVTSNLYGDVLSSLAAGLAGGVGLLAGGSFGDGVAVFEAGHGSAPKYAGQDCANPCGVILSGVLMLRFLGERDAADRVERAVLDVIREGRFLTRDLARDRDGTVVGTRAMAEAIRECVGRPS